jgi:uncharacterized membrane protein YwaF
MNNLPFELFNKRISILFLLFKEFIIFNPVYLGNVGINFCKLFACVQKVSNNLTIFLFVSNVRLF